jgi:coproporphyrinogen III oxidase-like Fe-S oxidoreductase
MYRTKNYIEKELTDIKREIDIISEMMPDTERIFLGDGDALNINTQNMVSILNYLYQKFPNLKRVSCYAMPKNLIQKKEEELKSLYESGLTMLYVGIESGNDEILKKITKGATSHTIIKGCQKAKDQGFVLSCMVILGLGGKTYTYQHIKDTANVISKVSPHYVGALNLQIEKPLYEEFMTKFQEPFSLLDDIEILDELERLISQIVPISPIIFRSNHASNVYSLGGTLPLESNKLIETINRLKSNPSLLKPKVLRRF